MYEIEYAPVKIREEIVEEVYYPPPVLETYVIEEVIQEDDTFIHKLTMPQKAVPPPPARPFDWTWLILILLCLLCLLLFFICLCCCMPRSKLRGPLLRGNVRVPLPAEPYREPKKAIIEETVVLRKEIPM